MRSTSSTPGMTRCRGPTGQFTEQVCTGYATLYTCSIDDPPYYDLEFVMAWRNASS